MSPPPPSFLRTLFLLPLLLLLSLLSLPSLSQINPYTSAPLIWHTFDVQPVGTAPANFSWVLGQNPHTGQAWLNGINGYIDLLNTRDDYGRTFPSVLPYTLSLEYWVTWSQVQRWSRIFECGQGILRDNMNVANVDTSTDLAVGIDSGLNNTRTTAYAVVKPTTWQHIVVTLAQHTRANNVTGTLSVYVDGVLVTYRNDSFLLKPVLREHCWIGRSEYNPPLGQDQWFSGYVDDFFYYDYPLSAEAVKAHFILPRPPVYELTFSTDPRAIQNPRPAAFTYGWSDRDLNDGANITKFHDGHLVLTGDSFIDMAMVSGPSSVGATPIPAIGGTNSGANGTLPRGWTIEVMVKALTVERWAKIYDIGSGIAVDNIILGYEDDANRLRFEYFVGTATELSMIVLPNATPNTWYHIAVTMAAGATQAANSVSAYVNGLRTNQTLGRPLPRGIGRAQAYIGKSHWDDQYFDCYLDAFRLYDYALTADEVTALYRSTIEQLEIDISTQTTPIYHTEPLAAFTFHSARTVNNSYGSQYTHLVANDSHYGIAWFNGRTDYIDLARFPDDPSPPLTPGKEGRLMPLRIGGSMSFEVWVKWLSLNTFSRVFDLGAMFNSNQNTIILANAGGRPDLLFETYAGSNYGGVIVPNAIRVGQWMHIVATVQQRGPNDTTSATAGLFKIYVDGVLQRSAVGYLPYTFTHPSSFIGRSNYLTDGLFHGLVDQLYFYDYALQYEQVAAHHILPRPPAFELAFTYDPRPWLGGSLSAYTYRWEEFDAADQGLNSTSYHNGYLVLEGDSWVNLTATSGYSTVGTTLPAELFLPVTGAGPIIQPANNINYGWSIEVLVKLETLEESTMVFDFGNGPNADNVRLGYSGLERQLVFSIVRPVAAQSTSVPVVTNTVLGRWYHILIVLRNVIGGDRCSVSVFVDGEGPVTVGQRWMPTGVPRSNAFLGRSNEARTAYFDMKLDTFRIYDYAITTAKAAELYALTTAPLPDPVLPLYDTAPIAQYTFDSQPDFNDGITSFTWLPNDPMAPAHTGIAHFNGDTQFVNLMTFLDDAGTPFPAVWGNTSLSFEAWVKHERFGWYSRVFDFGNGAEGDNVMLANFEDTPRIAVHVYASDAGNSSIMNLQAQYAADYWEHIVVTMEDQSKSAPALVTRGRNGYDAALYSVYVQGQLVGQRRGYIPRAVERTQSFLAKSHWVWDELFKGSIDSFYFFNYALSGEQVLVHPHPAQAARVRPVLLAGPAPAAGHCPLPVWLAGVRPHRLVRQRHALPHGPPRAGLVVQPVGGPERAARRHVGGCGAAAHRRAHHAHQRHDAGLVVRGDREDQHDGLVGQAAGLVQRAVLGQHRRRLRGRRHQPHRGGLQRARHRPADQRHDAGAQGGAEPLVPHRGGDDPSGRLGLERALGRLRRRRVHRRRGQQDPPAERRPH